MTPSTRALLGLLIRRQRRCDRISRQEMGERFGMTERQIEAIESGFYEHGPTIVKIAVGLGIDVFSLPLEPSLTPRWRRE